MSTKSTILLTNCCHIYHDLGYQHSDDKANHGKEVLVIEVEYGFIDDEKQGDQSAIIVEYNSDFAAMILHMIKTCGADVLDEFCRKHYENNLKQ